MHILMSEAKSRRYAQGDDSILRPYLDAAANLANRFRAPVEVWAKSEPRILVAIVDPAPPKTYLTKKVAGVFPAICGELVWAYGSLFSYADFCGSHRSAYNDNDAQAVCDWLNQRERGYEGVLV
jgi:hypothetical protein